MRSFGVKARIRHKRIVVPDGHWRCIACDKITKYPGGVTPRLREFLCKKCDEYHEKIAQEWRELRAQREKKWEKQKELMAIRYKFRDLPPCASAAQARR